jgi:adenylate cyclase
MNRTAGVEHRTNKKRSSTREAPLAILRKWTRNSALRNIAGESCTLSFLVCRIRGFEQLAVSYEADPDGLCRFVRRGATLMADAVHAHGGTIDRVFAGGFSAYFNATPETDAHAPKACACALAMVLAAEEVNAKSAGSDPLRIGIGLNTGSAIIGDFGTEDEPYYAAVGSAAERADALERLSSLYGTIILAGPAMEKKAGRSFPFLQVDLQTDNAGEPSPVWTLLAPPFSRSHPKFLALKSFHARLFDALRARDWQQARAVVAQCHALSGANPVLCDFYLQRIAHFEAHPPEDAWNGVLTSAAS